MPQFHLNRPARRAHPYYDLSEFAKGYVEAMFFTNGDTGDERENLLNDWGVERLTHASVAAIASDCETFLAHPMPDGHTLEQWLDSVSDSYDLDRAGNDFWFTRQGHGVGYWDRRDLNLDMWSDDTNPGAPWEAIAPNEPTEGMTFKGVFRNYLTEAAEAAGEVYPVVYRGWIYHR